MGKQQIAIGGLNLRLCKDEIILEHNGSSYGYRSGFHADIERYFTTLQTRFRDFIPTVGTSMEHIMLTMSVADEVRVELVANKYIGRIVSIGVSDPKLKTHVNLSLANRTVECVDIFDGYVSSYQQYPTAEEAIEMFIDRLCLTVSATKQDCFSVHGRDVCV